MKYTTYRVSLDIHDTHSQFSITVKKGDVSRQIIATLTEEGKPYELTDDCYAVLVGVKPDDKQLLNSCIIEGNRIKYNFTEQTVSAVGRVDCEIKVYGADGAELIAPQFSIIVVDTLYDKDDIVVISTDETTALKNFVDEAKEQINKIKSEEFKDEIKGDPGEQGLQGERGEPGADGYTPQRGTDYWTEADIAEIKSYVDEAILGGAW